MRLYVIHMDPETGMIEPERPITKLRVEKETDTHYTLDSGRKIDKKSGIYQFYPTKEAAKKDRVQHLLYLRKFYKSRLTVVNRALIHSPYHRWGGGKSKSLIYVNRPDGTRTLCTRARAAEIAGVHVSSVSRLLQDGNKSKSGYSFEYHNLEEA